MDLLRQLSLLRSCRSAATISLTSSGNVDFVAPAELGVGLARIAEQQFDFRRPEISRIDAHQRIAVLGIITDFVDARALPAIVVPTSANANSTNSRTECVSPVASTKSSGCVCCTIRHMPST